MDSTGIKADPDIRVKLEPPMFAAKISQEREIRIGVTKAEAEVADPDCDVPLAVIDAEHGLPSLLVEHDIKDLVGLFFHLPSLNHIRRLVSS